jgi:hypothetical protein
LRTIELAAGEKRLVSFRLMPVDFAPLGEDPSHPAETGEVEILVGPSADRSLLDQRIVALPPPHMARASPDAGRQET